MVSITRFKDDRGHRVECDQAVHGINLIPPPQAERRERRCPLTEADLARRQIAALTKCKATVQRVAVVGRAGYVI